MSKRRILTLTRCRHRISCPSLNHIVSHLELLVDGNEIPVLLLNDFLHIIFIVLHEGVLLLCERICFRSGRANQRDPRDVLGLSHPGRATQTLLQFRSVGFMSQHVDPVASLQVQTSIPNLLVDQDDANISVCSEEADSQFLLRRGLIPADAHKLTPEEAFADLDEESNLVLELSEYDDLVIRVIMQHMDDSIGVII